MPVLFSRYNSVYRCLQFVLVVVVVAVGINTTMDTGNGDGGSVVGGRLIILHLYDYQLVLWNVCLAKQKMSVAVVAVVLLMVWR